ncbi:unnamed protein product [Ixodes hexagonus]
MFTKLKKRIEEENQTELNIGIPTSLPSPTPTHSRRASESGGTTPVRSTCSEASDSDREQKTKVSQESYTVVKWVSGSDHPRQGTRGGTPKKSEPVAEYGEIYHKLQLIKQASFYLERRLRESEHRVELLASQRENREELESFQSQEMAKVKHLLLCSQQELRAADEKLRQRSEECRLAQERVCELERASQKAQGDQGRTRELLREKTSLEAEVDRLKQEALQNSGRISQLECTLGNLTDEHDGLKHTHDLYKSKTTSLLDEKDSSISDLEDKVRTLEKRLDGAGLTGDEQVQSLIEERKALEKKLDESRQHLSEVKSSWSEKINNLESQIFNLNQKMAEDAQECSRLERQLEETALKLKTTEQNCWTLEEQLQQKTSELAALQQSKEEELRRQRSQQDAQLDELRLQVAALRSDLSQAHRDRDKEAQEAQARIAELQRKDAEHQKSLEYIQKLEETSSASANKVAQLERELSLVTHSETSLRQAIKQNQAEMKAMSEELDVLKLRNASLSGDNERLKQEAGESRSQGDEERRDFEQELEKLRAALREATSKLQSLESQASASAESSASQEELRAKVAQLEDQLQERNKAMKLQQQRISDMKKTIQRELKCQQNAGSEGIQSNDSAVDQGSAASAGDAATTRGLANATSSRPGNHCVEGSKLEDDINFKYLKHVVFKFMTSKEYEAQHLIRAVSVLLRFTADEEQLIREHLDWKSSWFGSRPQVHPHHQQPPPHLPHPHHASHRHQSQQHQHRSSVALGTHSKAGTRPS